LCTENKARESRSDGHCAFLAIPSVVHANHGDASSQPCVASEKSEAAVVTTSSRGHPSSSTQDETPHMQAVRRSLQTSRISTKAFEVISHSWRKGTSKQYSTYIGKWKKFCDQRKISFDEPSVGEVLDFLVVLFEDGLGYSAINTARCALSTFISIGSSTIGAHPLVVRFLKGVFNQRPTKTRHTHVWDVATVLTFMKTVSPAKFLSLKDLTMKLVVLMALVSAQRAQTLHLLDTLHMKKHKHCFEFQIHSVLKQTRPGHGAPTLLFKSYAPDKRLCVFTYITEYLSRTKLLRKHSQFFLSYKKPFLPVGKDTISRWIKTFLHRAGIDEMFTAHSTRSASTSTAAVSLPIDCVLQAAGWSSAQIFAKYYKKPLSKKQDFAEAVLGGASK